MGHPIHAGTADIATVVDRRIIVQQYAPQGVAKAALFIQNDAIKDETLKEVAAASAAN